MQTVSDTYRRIAEGKYTTECKLSVSGVEYEESALFEMDSEQRVFSGDTPAVGDCVARELQVVMKKPAAVIPRQAELKPYVRIKNESEVSEWLQKGVYYIDTRQEEPTRSFTRLTIHAYDAMLRAEADFPASEDNWPRTDIQVVQTIAGAMGVSVDPRTVAVMTKGYVVQYPAEYTQRETLGYIAAMYGGCFVMSDRGELRLVQLNALPAATNYLITGTGAAITLGGVRILV